MESLNKSRININFRIFYLRAYNLDLSPEENELVIVLLEYKLKKIYVSIQKIYP